MHFLCLHGLGTNSHVFETQTASIRYEMDHHHTFDFVEGTESCPIAPEIKSFYSSTDKYFRYFGPSAGSVSSALSQLSTFIIEEGPFDGVIAFSQGAALISTYLIQLSQQRPGETLPFRCVIFFSGSRPFDIDALAKGEMRHIEPDIAGPLLRLPTSHIWGQMDVLYKDHSEVLQSLCEESQRDGYVHGQGHEIPSARAKEDVERCVRAIRRTVDKASIEC